MKSYAFSEKYYNPGRACLCTYVYACAYVYVYLCICLCLYECACMCTSVCVCPSVPVCLPLYACERAYNMLYFMKW